MSLDRFDYQQMVQDALRSVVRQTLQEVAENGLPGVHHFYITYETTYPGVTLSQELRDKYPEQITVVLQHDYRHLDVEEDRFSVTLHFGGLPQRIVVPFKALSAFYDPSEQFVLRFEPDDEPEPSVIDGDLLDQPAPAGSLQLPVRAVLQAADRMQAAKEAEAHEEEDPDETTPETGPADLPTVRDESAPSQVTAAEKPAVAPAPEAAEEEGDADPPAVEEETAPPEPKAEPKPGNVVSIDAFRRK